MGQVLGSFEHFDAVEWEFRPGRIAAVDWVDLEDEIEAGDCRNYRGHQKELEDDCFGGEMVHDELQLEEL